MSTQEPIRRIYAFIEIGETKQDAIKRVLKKRGLTLEEAVAKKIKIQFANDPDRRR